jgi:hypothetical protein
MDSNNLTYVVIPTSQLYKVDFQQLYSTYLNEVAIGTSRVSIDTTKTFVKYYGTEPSCMTDITGKEGPYTNEEIIAILQTPEWKLQSPPSGSL